MFKEKEYSIYPAIVVVGYDRNKSIERLLNSINEAFYPSEDIRLIVSLDYSDRTEDIVKNVKRIGWNHGSLDIVVRKPRLGLKEHILACGDLSEKYGAVIVLEDDLVVSKLFYLYVCQAIERYYDDSNIAGIALYSHAWNGYSNYEFIPQKDEHDAYFGQFSITWGQCWTDKQWKKFKSWYEENKQFPRNDLRLPQQIERWGEKSWGRFYVRYIVHKQLYYVIPYYSLTTNFSEVGEHSSAINTAHQVMLDGSSCGRDYLLPDFSKGIKYDVFFERILDGIDIDGIDGKEICVNLNGIKRCSFDKKYLLTMCKSSNLALVKSFTFQRRPVEENVINRSYGHDIFLYELPQEGMTLENSLNNMRRVSYEMHNHGWWRAYLYACWKAHERFRYAIKKIRFYMKRKRN